MRAVVQRVRRAAVWIEDRAVAQIGAGLVALVGVRQGDAEEDARLLARKTSRLRIFADDEGKMNRSVQDVGGSVLSVSQFTLYGDVRHGNRPGFVDAAGPEEAHHLYEVFNGALREAGIAVATGVFGAAMLVEIHNDGPVTILLDTEVLRR
ncbi:MAG: D-aminoacyl-tRNA deacylase [Armatimonadota bacterium]|nr:D-aminoacyl-tRNA deacylase [Armatimonadota bacterium]MDR5697978.1 D-aminoacyl-tRNA deacylase [Armatimonadota bacterium]